MQLVADDIHEPTDTFQISLSTPNDQEIAVQLNPNTATITIRDDDSECICNYLNVFSFLLNRICNLHKPGFTLKSCTDNRHLQWTIPILTFSTGM